MKHKESPFYYKRIGDMLYKLLITEITLKQFAYIVIMGESHETKKAFYDAKSE